MQIEKIQCTECTIVERQEGRIIGYYLYEIQIRSGERTLVVTDDAKRRKREEKRERKKNGYKWRRSWRNEGAIIVEEYGRAKTNDLTYLNGAVPNESKFNRVSQPSLIVLDFTNAPSDWKKENCRKWKILTGINANKLINERLRLSSSSTGTNLIEHSQHITKSTHSRNFILNLLKFLSSSHPHIHLSIYIFVHKTKGRKIWKIKEKLKKWKCESMITICANKLINVFALLFGQYFHFYIDLA